MKRRTTKRDARRWACLAVGLLACNAGCTTFSKKSTSSPVTPVAESGLMQAGHTEGPLAPSKAAASVDPNWDEGEEFYKAEDYSKAESKFHAVAENTKNPPMLAEKARFYEAECLRMQKYYPKASDTYSKMLTDFPSGVYRERAVGMMYQIANYWLEETRDELAKLEGQSGGWLSSNYIHLTDRTKPTLDQEGRALELLTKVHVNDPTGPYSDKALYLIGYVNFVRNNFREADHAFSQLVELHEKSPLRAKAAEMAIMAKNNSTGGPDYDGQKAAEALRLVQTAKGSMPELVKERGEFLDRQIVAIRQQQAEKDFKMAEFYRRTGHPGSAWFYYELVRRRYPNTLLAEQANDRMTALTTEMDNVRNRSDGSWGDMKRSFNRWVLGRNTDVRGYNGENTLAGVAAPPEAKKDDVKQAGAMEPAAATEKK